MNTISISSTLSQVQARIASAAQAAERPASDVRLIAVSKRFPAEMIQAAYDAGQREFGESYINESLTKIEALKDLDICWHFIGPVQSNKLKAIAQHYDWLHSLSSTSHAVKLNRHRQEAGLSPMNVCLQLNLSGETSKSGVTEDEIPALARQVSELEHLCLRGLMTLPAPSENLETQRVPFCRLREIKASLNSAGHSLDTLSMGMSSDLEAAVLEGATMVRVGTDIFGTRPA